MKDTLLRFFWASLFLAATGSVLGQPVKVQTRIDKSKILIGDAIQMSISATYNPFDFQVGFPVLPDTFNHFEIVEKLKPDTLQNGELHTISQKWHITNFDSGQWLIPAFELNIKSLKGAEPATLRSDSLWVFVNTPAVDTSKPFKPIFGIRSAQMPLKEILQYVAIGIGLLLLLILALYYFYKRYKQNKNKPVDKKPEPILPPHQKALNALLLLEQQNLWQEGKEKEYHTQLSDVIRSYLEEQFEIDCFEKTSSEIIAQVKRIKALSTSRQMLRYLFETADMVKFAKSKPTPEEHIQSLQHAKEVILESYKKIKPVDSAKPE